MPTRQQLSAARCAPIAAAAVAALAACASPKASRAPFADRPVRSASLEELTRRIGGDAAAIGSLRGKLSLGFQGGAGGEYRTCRGVLAARSPWVAGQASGLYVKGYRNLVPTLFTLVSDGSRFWLHVPRDNVVYTGPIARRRHGSGRRDLPLDARDLFRALFVQPLEAAAAVDVEEQPTAYVLSARDGGLVRRRLWIERRGLTVEREQFYDAAGREELYVERGRYVELGGHLLPERILLRDVPTGAAVTLEFDTLTPNPQDLGADAFRPRTPPDARIEAVAGTEEGA